MDNNNKFNNLDHFNLLRMIKNKPEASQRELAAQLGFSLGKLNYCLKSLKDKGLIKIENFKKIQKNKLYLHAYTKRNKCKNKINN